MIQYLLPAFLERTANDFTPSSEDAAKTIAQGFIQHRQEERDVRHETHRSTSEIALMNKEHALIIQSLNGVILDSNSAVELLLGYSRAEIIGASFGMLLPTDLHEEFKARSQKIAQGEETSQTRTELLHKNGQRIEVGLTTTPFRVQEAQVAYVIMVARAIDHANEWQPDLLRVQKLEALGQLAGGIAHDFNNLLTVILGASEILVNRYHLNESAQSLLAEIHKAGGRAETLIRQLLTLCHKSDFEASVIDLNVLVRNAETTLSQQIRPSVLLTTLVAAGPCQVIISAERMLQALLQLAMNAQDAMPDGGKITIETDNVIVEKSAHGSTSEIKPGKYALLACSDTGAGMDSSIKARVLEPFFTTKSSSGHAGLGLTMVNSIVKQRGGYLLVESEPGRGSSFKIYLPQFQQHSMPTQAPHSYSLTSGGETLLLVEDEDAVRTLASRILQSNGYQILEAKNGEEAFQIAEKNAGSIQLVISDLNMPLLGGRQLAERLHRLNAQIKILFLSGYPSDVLDLEGDSASSYAFLQKPFTSNALLEKVRCVLDETNVKRS